MAKSNYLLNTAKLIKITFSGYRFFVEYKSMYNLKIAFNQSKYVCKQKKNVSKYRFNLSVNSSIHKTLGTYLNWFNKNIVYVAFVFIHFSFYRMKPKRVR